MVQDRSRVEILGVSAALALAILARYGTALGDWWFADDPFVLDFAVRHSPFGYVASPERYRLFSPLAVIPWLPASFRLDWTLFGLAPRAFYAHQLLSLFAAGIALYATLRLALPPLAAAFGPIHLVLSPVGMAMALYLNTRHYVEGLLLSTVVAFCWLAADRSRPRLPAALGPVAYAAALACKEIFAPVPFILALVVGGPWRTKRRRLLPYLALAVVYALYRWWLLGRLIGGDYFPGRSLSLDAGALVAATLGSWPGVVIVAAILAIGLWTRSGRLALAGKAMICLAVALGTVLPVAAHLPTIHADPQSYRVLLAVGVWISVALSFSLGAAVRAGRATAVAGAILAVAAVASTVVHAQGVARTLGQLKHGHATEGRFYVAHLREPGTLQAQWVNDGMFFGGLRDLELRSHPGPARLRVVQNGYFCFDGCDGWEGPIYAYRSACACIVDQTERVLAQRAAVLRWLDPARPLAVDLEIREGLFIARLGPHRGHYAILASLLASPNAYDTIIETGPVFLSRLAVTAGPAILVRVGYVDPAGWATVSPEFAIRLEEGMRLHWQR